MKYSKITIALISITSFILVACPPKPEGNSNDVSSDTTGTAKPLNETAVKPLNVSIYLDLSDRLMRDLSPVQAERDTAIVNHIISLFIDDCVNNGKIIGSNNHFQIFFFPTPKSSQIATLAKTLNIDMAKINPKEKKIALLNMKNTFQKNLYQIYSDAISEQKWTGCDIWGFFSNKKVDELCVRKGYRNILVILTDGYLYHENNKIQDIASNSYSYVLPSTLSQKASLIIKRNGLENLEVLMLEINPYDLKQQTSLTEVLQNWFEGMGVTKLVIADTDLPSNTENIIDNFFKATH